MRNHAVVHTPFSFVRWDKKQLSHAARRGLQLLLGAVLLTYQFVAPAPSGAAENAQGEAAPSSADSPSSVGNILQSAPPPPNDDFDDATEISALPFSDVVDTAGATIALDDPDLGCADTDEPNSVWYRLLLGAAVFLQVVTFCS